MYVRKKKAKKKGFCYYIFLKVRSVSNPGFQENNKNKENYK